MTGPIWTVSNALSLARLLLVLPISWLLLGNDSSNNPYIVGLIIIAIMTDFFDGRIARRLGQVTEVGKIIDPIADKVAVGIVSLILSLQGKLPMWLLVTVLARDIIIFSGGLYIQKSKGVLLQSNEVGKWTVTILTMLLLVTILDINELLWLKEILIVTSLILLIVSFSLYVKRFLDAIVA